MKVGQWTNNEILFLKNNYTKMSSSELTNKLNRSESSIRNKKFILRLGKDNRWSDDELSYLSENYLDFTYSELSKNMDRSESSIQGKICNLGLSQDKKWDKLEDDILTNNYLSTNRIELSKKLNRSVFSIKARLSRLGLTKSNAWNEGDITFLNNNYQNMSCSELANKLNRSVVSIHVKKGRLGLIQRLPWSDKEDLFLKKNYLTMSNIDIAKSLKCEVSRISSKVTKLGLKRSKEWTANYMRELFVGKTYDERYGKEKADEMRKTASINFSGEGNPSYGKTPSIETRSKISKANIGRIPPNLESLHTSMKGEGNPMYGKFGRDHPAYINGKSNENYTKEWNKQFRRFIRKRDNKVCMICGIHREKLNRALSVHHMNYNKKMTYEQNCVSLCDSCHSKTNFNRKHWTKFFQSLLSERYGYQYSEVGEVILEFENLIPIVKR